MQVVGCGGQAMVRAVGKAVEDFVIFAYRNFSKLNP